MEYESSNISGPLLLDDLSAFEQDNELTLPDDYKQFLLNYNGGRPDENKVARFDTDVNWLYSWCDKPEWASFFYAIDTYQGRIPSWYIPIGYDSGGNVFIMSLFEENKGTVALWLHEDENPDDGTDYYKNVVKLADSFNEFISSLN